MKVVLNTTTSFEGAGLKQGDIVDVPLNIAERWINRGIAHEAPQVKVELSNKVKELIKQSETKEPLIKKQIKRKPKINDASYLKQTDKL